MLYLAADIEGAFIEGCIRDMGLGRARRVVSETFLRDRVLSRIAFEHPLRLVDLTGAGLAQIGADMRLCGRRLPCRSALVAGILAAY